jgi:hypothetical protein
MTTTDALGIIEAEVGTAIDGDCFQALRETVETAESPGRWNVA